MLTPKELQPKDGDRLKSTTKEQPHQVRAYSLFEIAAISVWVYWGMDLLQRLI